MTDVPCVPSCVEGCHCPEGQSMDKMGKCVDAGMCDGSESGQGLPEARKRLGGMKPKN